MSPKPTSENTNPELTERLSPFALKMIITSAIKYRRAYRSYSFGSKLKLRGKWIYILAIGIVAIVVILYLTGNLPTGR